MSNTVVNYDGSITAHPRQLIYPETAEQIQAVLKDSVTYPSPVRAKGSYHSLTPCASTDGTMFDMSRMTKIIEINTTGNFITAQAGLQIVDANHAMREADRQFMTNVEIGNMTLGAASCCHSKDALDGIEFGQFGSYLTGMKWVNPAGDLCEATQATNPDLLRLMRSSYGLAGVVYEVTYKIKPIEAIHLTYLPLPVEELTEAQVDNLLDSAEGLICWTVDRTCIFQARHRIADAGILAAIKALARQKLWNFGAAYAGHVIDEFMTTKALRDGLENLDFDVMRLLYSTLHLFGGITLLSPDKTIDYRQTPATAKYAFTFWAFPRSKWLATLREYLDFAEQHFKTTGFRCNMPLGAYHIHRDTNAILSYTHDEEIFSIDPIHASTDDEAWHYFLRQFNEFAFQRGGVPLLNQSPFVERKHVEAAYGQRWVEFAQWIKTVDPQGRMLNPYFADLLPQ